MTNQDREVNYLNWLASEQLDDNTERREAFEAGWEYLLDIMRERLRRL